MKIDEILSMIPLYRFNRNSDDEITLSSKFDEEEFKFTAFKKAEKTNDWEIMFISQTSGFALTKRGNEFKIFALAGELIRILIKEQKPEKIYFGADKEEGRVKLYKKLGKKVPGYTMSEGDSDSDSTIDIILTRNDLVE